MLSKIYHFSNKLREKLSRTRFLLRILGFHEEEDSDKEKPGFIAIQIDGLSRKQLARAFEERRMPFLKSLTKENHHILKTFYPGMPSTTPAVQAELFYGKSCFVPAFQFRDFRSQKMVRMFEQDTVENLASELNKDSVPLLKGGSSYSNIYSGGAEETLFCIEKLGVKSIFSNIRPFQTFVLTISHIPEIVKMVALSLVELVISFASFIKGIFNGHSIWKEFKFIPARISVSILLREIITFSVKMDIARGKPKIHLNLLGYDEQAHRRGPNSKFAQWTLKGIDHCIASIYKQAEHSKKRDYHIVIYSDHGQEEVIPYHSLSGKSLEENIHRVLKEKQATAKTKYSQAESRISKQRNLAEGIFRKVSGLMDWSDNSNPQDYQLSWMGPVSHLYLNTNNQENIDVDIADIALDLIDQYQIPAVYWKGDDGEILGYNGSRVASVLAEPALFFGKDHPVLERITHDWVKLCNHKNSGQLILSGFHPHKKPVSFPNENGAHGGPGPEESSGFILMEKRMDDGSEVIRPKDLRSLLMAQNKIQPISSHQKNTSGLLNVVTYNIQSCLGLDGKVRPFRIARALASLKPDLVALQEIDKNNLRTFEENQIEIIADYLGMQYHFLPLIKSDESSYGIGILLRAPFEIIKAEPLNNPHHNLFNEPRGAIWAKTTLNGQPIHFINTHLGLTKRERSEQIHNLLSDQWLRPILNGDETVLLAGDLNLIPRSKEYKILSNYFNIRTPVNRKSATYWAIKPFLQLDHIFVTGNLKLNDSNPVRTQTTKLASDHLPVQALFQQLK